jgi:hypothetical protein
MTAESSSYMIFRTLGILSRRLNGTDYSWEEAAARVICLRPDSMTQR